MSLNNFNFDYEFNFFTDDITNIDKFNIIYNQCTLQDLSGNRRNLIYTKCLDILTLLSVASGIRTFSSFITIDNKKYKVTVSNTQWSGSGLF